MSLDLQWLHEHMLLYFVYICGIEKFNFCIHEKLPIFFFSFDTDKQSMLSLLCYQYERIHVKLKGEKISHTWWHFSKHCDREFLLLGLGFWFFWAWEIMGKFLYYCPLVVSRYRLEKLQYFECFLLEFFFFFFKFLKGVVWELHN